MSLSRPLPMDGPWSSTMGYRLPTAHTLPGQAPRSLVPALQVHSVWPPVHHQNHTIPIVMHTQPGHGGQKPAHATQTIHHTQHPVPVADQCPAPTPPTPPTPETPNVFSQAAAAAAALTQVLQSVVPRFLFSSAQPAVVEEGPALQTPALSPRSVARTQGMTGYAVRQVRSMVPTVPAQTAPMGMLAASQGVQMPKVLSVPNTVAMPALQVQAPLAWTRPPGGMICSQAANGKPQAGQPKTVCTIVHPPRAPVSWLNDSVSHGTDAHSAEVIFSNILQDPSQSI